MLRKKNFEEILSRNCKALKITLSLKKKTDGTELMNLCFSCFTAFVNSFLPEAKEVPLGKRWCVKLLDVKSLSVASVNKFLSSESPSIKLGDWAVNSPKLIPFSSFF